jgi:hypothetical protein
MLLVTEKIRMKEYLKEKDYYSPERMPMNKQISVP